MLSLAGISHSHASKIGLRNGEKRGSVFAGAGAESRDLPGRELALAGTDDVFRPAVQPCRLRLASVTT